MKQTNRLGLGAIKWVALTSIGLLLARNGLWLVGVATLGAVEFYRWRRDESGWDAVSLDGPQWLVAASMLLLTALVVQMAVAWILAGAYLAWRAWYSQSPKASAMAAIVSQSLALVGIFMAAIFWHWPTALVLVLVWLVAWLVADRFLRLHNERARPVMAAAWALVASQTSWIFMVWAVSYVISLPARLGGLTIVLPQAAIVLSTLSYCLGGIYVSHAAGRLNRSRLIEYLMIGLGLIVMVIAGTRWNGVI